MNLQDFLVEKMAGEPLPTEDVLTSFLPLVREVIDAHRVGCVAPLEGLQELHVDGNRIWFEEAKRQPLRSVAAEVDRIELASTVAVEVLAESRRTTDVGDGHEQLLRVDIGTRGMPPVRPVYLSGYVSWEHELGHHDPLTDVFSLGLVLASLACGLNLSEPSELESFVVHRRNLFALNAHLHPVLAQAIQRMTELVRRHRPQDLTALLRGLEDYRDQTVGFEVDLARLPGFAERDAHTKQQVVVSKLRDRLFDISRRNSLLHYRQTAQSVNLTQSSIPLLLDIRNIREDQLLIWSDQLRKQIVEGKPIALNKYLNFAEAIYLPSLLERVIADARRDRNEYGFAQLRLVLCFLTWANLKEKPAERYVSPLVLLPVALSKTKGIRDTYFLEPLSTEAEINPVVRHQFRQLYNISLPETIDLETTSLDTLVEYLTAQIQASEAAVTVNRIDRPRIELVHEKARRRLDQYRRTARVSGRGVRNFLSLDYSYDPVNYHPLGIKLFSAKLRTPGSHLRTIVEEAPRPRSYASGHPEVTGQSDGNVIEVERSLYHLRDATEDNPYLWNIDFCNLTLANLRYRRMSLVRDYEAILQGQLANQAFDATFSLMPRPLGRELPTAPALEDRYDVVPCDPTQATAIAEARSGTSYIIQGPPGTGKSQTITNLIADFVARGKRVLFVCEKRAALDVVFARLRQCGLGQLCCFIHDSQTDKKEFILDLKQTYEAFTAEKPPSGGGELSREELLRQIQQHSQPLERFDTAMETVVDQVGLPLRPFLDRYAQLQDLCPALTPEDAERLPSYSQWWSHRDRLAGLEPALNELEPSGVLSRHPLRLLNPRLSRAECPMEVVTSGTRHATDLLERLSEMLDQSEAPEDTWPTFESIHELLDYVRLAAPLSRHGNLALSKAGSERQRKFTVALERVRQHEAAVTSARQSTTAWIHKLPAEDVKTALEQVQQLDGNYFAGLSPTWWRLRGVLRRSYNFQSHAVRPTWKQALSALDREYAAVAECEQAIRQTQLDFELASDPREAARLARSISEQTQRMSERLRRLHATLLESSEADAIVERVLAAGVAASELARCLEPVLVDYNRLTLEQLADYLVQIGSMSRQVPQALSLLDELGKLPPAVSTTLRETPLTLRQAEAGIARHTWEEMSCVDRGLGRFDGRTRQRHVRRLETLYDAWLNANAVEVCQRVRERFLENVRISQLPASQLTPEQRDFKKRHSQGRRTLEHEFGKTMRYRAIRELVDGEPGTVVRDLKPVWLMSPLSVSDTLPMATDLVDVVIFDEASQVPLEESVPSLFRGRQVIVVGDEMQLPPTDFFSTKQTAEEDAVMITEGEERVRYDLESDSFLGHAAKNLAATMLGWHYRSRSESLISYSNWAFYDGRLLTVPDCRLMQSQPKATANQQNTDAGLEHLLTRPLSFHLLNGAVYDKQRNRAEAEYIAVLVTDLLRRRLGLSIGVIAFSEAQQDEIEAALKRLAEQDNEIQQLYEAELEREVDGQFVGLLVKNLENIQGDERDVIILSICYGHGPTGKMLMNFGPINRSGGEKRLNVAFSRAKKLMAVVSSIQYSDITNDYNEGPSCLKNYLRYADAASRDDVETVRRVLGNVTRWRQHEAGRSGVAQDAVCQQLVASLKNHGYRVDERVGQSHFRVDLAIYRPGDTTYRLGILVDTLASYEQTDSLERCMMRPRLLRLFGWRVAAVLAKDWCDDREAELQRVLNILEGGTDDSLDEHEDAAVVVDSQEQPVPKDRQAADNTSAFQSQLESVSEPGAPGSRTSIAQAKVGLDEDARANATKPAPVVAHSRPKRYFEFVEGNSKKFWEIEIADNQHTVRFGRIGTSGQSLCKTFADEITVQRDAERLIREKIGKGYRETAAG